MSASNKKTGFTADAVRARAAQAGTQVGSLANKTLPVSQGASSAMAGVSPAVNAARSWAAPQLHGVAQLISETIAPAIAGALHSTADRVDVPKTKSGPGKGAIAGAVTAAAAAAGAATAAAVRMRKGSNNNTTTTTTTPVATNETVIYDSQAGPAPYASQAPSRPDGGYSNVV